MNSKKCLMLIHAWAHLYTSTSGLSLRSTQGRNGRPWDLRPLSFGRVSEHHSNELNDGSHIVRLLLRCNILAVVASSILFLSPTLASGVSSTDSIHQTDSVFYCDGIWSSSNVITVADLSALSASSISELGLKPATEDKPQITLNGGSINDQTSKQTMSIKSKAREPILQGLVYFPATAKIPAAQQESQELDYYSDVLVLTAVSASHSDGPALAGAKFPLSSVRFPFSFQMYEENLLMSRPGVRDAWENVVNTGDIVLRANICPSDSSAFPCQDNERKKYAQGVAKLISNLPGLKDGEYIRAPASLALQ
jgi:hypothetical protein